MYTQRPPQQPFAETEESSVLLESLPHFIFASLSLQCRGSKLGSLLHEANVLLLCYALAL